MRQTVGLSRRWRSPWRVVRESMRYRTKWSGWPDLNRRPLPRERMTLICYQEFMRITRMRTITCGVFGYRSITLNHAGYDSHCGRIVATANGRSAEDKPGVTKLPGAILDSGEAAGP